MESALNILGPKFSGVLIEDPILEPFFITSEALGGYTVSKKRVDSAGNFKYSDMCYPGTLERCLIYISKEKLAETGVFSSLQDYISKWKQITDDIFKVCRQAGINKS